MENIKKNTNKNAQTGIGSLVRENNDNSMLNEKKIEPRKLPGLYMIHCFENDYRYYGETSNLSGRISSHKSMLRRKIHPNKELQKDWNTFSEEIFRFQVLYIGEEWDDRIVRLKRESELIGRDLEKCYNFYESMDKRVGELNGFFKKRHSSATLSLMREAKKGIPNLLLGRKITILGKEYPSIAEASRQTGYSRKLIRTRIDSNLYPDWKPV